MRDVLVAVSIVPSMYFGFALLFDVKGFRTDFEGRWGEERREAVKRFRVAAVLGAALLFGLPVLAVLSFGR
ncbi:hypothetical protein [Streptomyces termitum]|uniref:hypothetical protein n=1 Tax=Streptomyces termitum TaxID=67368 RepID=UPI00339E5C99